MTIKQKSKSLRVMFFGLCYVDLLSFFFDNKIKQINKYAKETSKIENKN